MALCINNAHAERLVRQVAAAKGECLTEAVVHSLEEGLQRLEGHRTAPDLFETLMTIGRRCSALPDLDTRSADENLGYDGIGTFRCW